MPSPFAQKNIDVFCRVIDNLGDVGVCWRLARQLSRECGAQVQLIVDDLSPFSVIEPRVTGALHSQTLDGIHIATWAAFEAKKSECTAEIVIEAFGCDPPADYVTSMAARDRKPMWINLEYLSAEAWVDGVHGLPSPHPKLPLTKYFFVPGFTDKSGGLIRESNLSHTEKPTPGITIQNATDAALRVFAFTYPHAPVRALVDGFAKANHTLTVHVASPLHDTDPAWKTLEPVAQTAFDARLAPFDVLLVRGEDSFLRAQFAAKPMLWHIYPTDDDAHVKKLDAWLDLYCGGLDENAAHAMRAANHTLISRPGDISYENQLTAFAAFARALPELTAHALAWREQLFSTSSLVQRLELFYATQQATPRAS